MLTIARTLIILHCVFVFFFPPEVARAFVAARNCDTATCHHLKKKKKNTVWLSMHLVLLPISRASGLGSAHSLHSAKALKSAPALLAE